MSDRIRQQHATVALMVAFLLLMCALALQLVTLADGHYRGVLLTALALTAITDLTLAFAFVRGRVVARILCVVLFLPTAFIVWDFIRRSNSVF